eukprot:scaffold2482_cov166-Amphora_coffeaeformis.AAC.6
MANIKYIFSLLPNEIRPPLSFETNCMYMNLISRLVDVQDSYFRLRSSVCFEWCTRFSALTLTSSRSERIPPSGQHYRRKQTQIGVERRERRPTRGQIFARLRPSSVEECFVGSSAKAAGSGALDRATLYHRPPFASSPHIKNAQNGFES